MIRPKASPTILNGNRTIVTTACVVAPRTLSGSFDWVVVVVVVVVGAWPFSAVSLRSLVTAPPSGLVTLVVVVVLSPLEHPWANTTAQDANAAANNTASRFILDPPRIFARPAAPARALECKDQHIMTGSGANSVTGGDEKIAKAKKSGRDSPGAHGMNGSGPASRPHGCLARGDNRTCAKEVAKALGAASGGFLSLIPLKTPSVAPGALP